MNCGMLAGLCLAAMAGNADATLILIDFGSAGTQTIQSPAGTYWNNVTDSVVLPTVGNLLTTTNALSGFGLTVTSRFNGANGNGAPSGAGAYPGSATIDSLYGNTGTGFNGIAAPNPSFTLSGLDPLTPYTFSFYASRIGAGGEVRTTNYAVAGANSGSAILNASENTLLSVPVQDIYPTAGGNITVTLSAAASNTNMHKFVYLGVMEMTYVPEPGVALLLPAAGLLMLAKRRREGVASGLAGERN